jgi:hypothetical protein
MGTLFIDINMLKILWKLTLNCTTCTPWFLGQSHGIPHWTHRTFLPYSCGHNWWHTLVCELIRLYHSYCHRSSLTEPNSESVLFAFWWYICKIHFKIWNWHISATSCRSLVGKSKAQSKYLHFSSWHKQFWNFTTILSTTVNSACLRSLFVKTRPET